MELTKKDKFSLVLCIIASFISSLTLVMTPFYLGKAIDLMVGQGNVDMEGVFYYLSMTAVFYLINFAAGWVSMLIANNISINFVKELRIKLQNHISRLPISYLDTHSHGNLQSLFAMDGELILDGLYQFLTQLLNGIFVVLIASYFMFTINVGMTFIVFALVPLVFLTSHIVSKKSLRLFKKQQDLAGRLSGKSSEFIDNHVLVTTSNYQEESIKEFVEINEKLSDIGVRAQFLSAMTNPTTRVVNNLSYLLLGLTGALSAINYGLSIGMLTSFISYSMMFSKPFNEFSAIVAQIQAGRAGYQRFQEVLAEPLEVDSEKHVELKGDVVTFDDVAFSYNKNNPLIENLNLQIEPLSKVAIVGPTGAGKSTLINLLMRFYDVNKGTIAIDGVDTHSIARSDTRNLMGIVLQDPWLFEGTILDNIKYGKPDASLEEVKEATRQAGCYDYIMSLDHQFDTQVSLGSQNISLGQKQMITIARALIVDAPIIILDEATSSIDVVTEKRIQSIFTQIMKSHTSFFVAHRLSTVIDSDVILVMKEGHLIEQGTHHELMSLKGFYHDLYMSQF